MKGGTLTLKILRESVLLILICTLDSVSTFVLIETGVATEMNPLMNWVLGYGWLPFFAVKGITVGLAVGFAEWLHRYSQVASRWLRVTCWLYLGLWILGVVVGNLALRMGR